MILKKAYVIWWFIVFVVWFLALYPLFLVLLSTPKLYSLANHLRRVWAILHCICTGIVPSITRKGNTVTGPAIYCANHFSYMDIVLFSLVCKSNFCFMAKAELTDIPLFGIFFKTVDISVNRKSRGDSFEALQEAGRRLKEGYSIIIFPEGTIHGKAPRMGHFKNGPFKLAIDMHVPLVPVTFLDNFKRFDIDATFGGSPGIARANVHPAMNTTDGSEANAELYKMRTFELLQTDLQHVYGDNA